MTRAQSHPFCCWEIQTIVLNIWFSVCFHPEVKAVTEERRFKCRVSVGIFIFVFRSVIFFYRRYLVSKHPVLFYGLCVSVIGLFFHFHCLNLNISYINRCSILSLAAPDGKLRACSAMNQRAI